MSPDLLGGEISNPQSLNRYAYVGNNPLNFTDALGLCGDDGRINPHCGPTSVGGSNDTTCFLDGVVDSCSDVVAQIQAGSAVMCPQCQPRQIVGADNNIYTWVAPASAMLDNEDGTFTMVTQNGYWKSSNFPAADTSQSVLIDSQYDIFHCPGCREKWEAANYVTTWKFVRTFYGYSALAAIGASPVEGALVDATQEGVAQLETMGVPTTKAIGWANQAVARAGTGPGWGQLLRWISSRFF